MTINTSHNKNADAKSVRFFKPFWDERELDAAVASNRDALVSLESALLPLCPPGAAAVPTSSGRTALELALRVLKRVEPRRPHVAIPTYACRAIFDAVLKAGLVPVFVDCEATLNFSTEHFRRIAGKEILAVVIAHTSGCAADADAIMETADRFGIFTIDDSAQSPGLAPPKREPHFAVYSFGFGKMLSATAGGAVTSAAFKDEIKHESSLLGVESDRAVKARFDYIVSKYFLPKNSRAKPETPGEPCGPAVPFALSSYGYNAIHPLDAAIAVVQIGKLPEIIERRRKNSALIIKTLEKSPGVRFQSPAAHVYSRLTLIIEDAFSREKLRRIFEENRIETEPMYMPLHKAAFAAKYAPSKPLEYSERIYPACFNVPNRANLDSGELERICKIILPARPS
jgi:dTDP-4-amino-4,6-dideoxygalactose transaminase